MLEIGNEKRGYCFDSTEHKMLRSLQLVCGRNVEESWAVNLCYYQMNSVDCDGRSLETNSRERTGGSRAPLPKVQRRTRTLSGSEFGAIHLLLASFRLRPESWVKLSLKVLDHGFIPLNDWTAWPDESRPCPYQILPWMESLETLLCLGFTAYNLWSYLLHSSLHIDYLEVNKVV